VLVPYQPPIQCWLSHLLFTNTEGKTNIQIPVQSFSSFKYCAIYPMNGDDLIMTPIKPAAYPFFRQITASM